MNIVYRVSEHRAFLMALAIVIIVIYHFKCWVNGFPWYIGMVLQFGYIGVDLFFFLSGLGLGFSYEKNDLWRFYQNRARRVFPSYFLYGNILALFMTSCGVEVSVGQMLYMFSLLEYIFDGLGTDWYVSSIIILYILFPIIYFFVKKFKEWLLFLLVPVVFFLSIKGDLQWTHLAMVQRLPMFIFGVWCAINRNDSKRTIRAFVLFVVFLFLLSGYAVSVWGIKIFISKNGCGLGFFFTDLLIPLFLLGMFNRYTYHYINQALSLLSNWGGAKNVGSEYITNILWNKPCNVVI